MLFLPNLSFFEHHILRKLANVSQYTQHKQPEVCVSYKWEVQSEKIVDEFCVQARGKGVYVIRDINELKMGDSIQAFMQRIGKGKRVVVILPDAYLKSGYCMYELYEIWRNAKADPVVFKQRVRVFKLGDVVINKTSARAEYASYWCAEFNTINELSKASGAMLLGVSGMEELKRINQFYSNISDILAEIADVLAPQDLEQLLEYGLQGLEV